MLRDALTYADVLAALQKDAPQARLGTLIKLRCRLSDAEWWPLLGLVWYACNHIADARRVLTPELKAAPAEHLRMMMSGQSASAWDALPMQFTVYRGCYAYNRTGLSWSTSRVVAEAFALEPRVRDPVEAPLVLTGSVQKQHCVLMLDRGEAEVVAWQVMRVGQNEVLRRLAE